MLTFCLAIHSPPAQGTRIAHVYGKGRASGEDEASPRGYPLAGYHFTLRRAYHFPTLKRKCAISPSWITYSFPSRRCKPFLEAAANEPVDMKSSKRVTSARIKPRSISESILPAAPGAFAPFVTVQARTSPSPAVRNVIRLSRRYP